MGQNSAFALPLVSCQNDLLYLDNAATTRPSDSVVAAMSAAMTDTFGNPSSRHRLGLEADQRLRQARRYVAERLSANPRRIIFTSGGTEALALAILGTAKRSKPGKLLISAIEHDAVRKSAELAESLGHRIEYIPPTTGGIITPEAVLERVTADTVLVAVMHVNNEIGTVQPIQDIARAIKLQFPKCRVLVDCIQSFGVLHTSMAALGADMIAISGHKIHGPKGIGALALGPQTTVAPLWGGGLQEAGLRAGTENVPGIVGLGVAARAGKGAPAALAEYCERLTAAFTEYVKGAYLLGDPKHRAPHIAAVALPGKRSDVFVNALSERGVFISSGSACHSRKSERSHVLQAIGFPANTGVLRIAPSATTTSRDIDRATQIIAETVSGL